MLPFTRDQFLAVFADYNAAIWPAPVVAYGLGALAVFFLFRPRGASDRLISAILAVMWLWTGVVYHGMYFTALNPVAVVFAAGFIAQGVGLFIVGSVLRRLRFRWQARPGRWIGAGLIFYAAVIYPMVGLWSGHIYPAAPVFGLTPCPVTLFTLGVLLMAVTHVPWGLLVVPALWAIVGGSAAILLDVPEDWALLIGGAVAIRLVAMRRVSAPSA
ncbi:MAG: DUF6064 family protein [Alphaproteobacteria bacterium]